MSTPYLSKNELERRLHIVTTALAVIVESHDELMPIVITPKQMAEADVKGLRLKTIDGNLVITKENLEG